MPFEKNLEFSCDPYYLQLKINKLLRVFLNRIAPRKVKRSKNNKSLIRQSQSMTTKMLLA